MTRTAYLILEDGTTFKGTSFGYEDESQGEVVFNTSMSGYQEVLTDPSYNGQIVAMTYPMIGNYGVNPEDVESDRVQVAGFVVREYSKTWSNHRGTSSLADYLKESKVSAIEGIDTRKLTRHIRNQGALRGGIFFDPEGAVERLKAHPRMSGLDLASNVSTRQIYDFGEHREGRPLVAVIDYGVKRSILRQLDETGFNVRVYPATTPFETIKNDGAKGVFLSNGPGDPDAVSYAPKTVQDISESRLPAFGICLGHQILALGLGGSTYKLKFGHRGANQPVRNTDGRVEITSQNHGFAVDLGSLKDRKDITITHMNLNDDTVEGLRHKELPVFSVQHHPEASPGPHDSRHLFHEFYEMVTGNSSQG
jgi:carbamoyl-phosphate synthase small subunit